MAKGERVGIWAPNCAEWAMVQYGCAKIGAILVNINPAYGSRELEYVLRQSGIRTLVAATAFKTSDYAGMIADVRPALPGPARTWCCSAARSGRPCRAATAPAGTGGAAALAAAQAALSADDPINIQYTSGTTGFPKGATLSHHNILNNGFFIGELCRYTEEDRICIPVPFYHCFGMVMGNLAATSHGACMVIPAPSFEPAATLRSVERNGAHRCTASRPCSSRNWRCPTSRRTT